MVNICFKMNDCKVYNEMFHFHSQPIPRSLYEDAFLLKHTSALNSHILILKVLLSQYFIIISVGTSFLVLQTILDIHLLVSEKRYFVPWVILLISEKIILFFSEKRQKGPILWHQKE